MSELEIRDLRADDESLYKCELTYLEVRDDCSVIQFVNLTTMGKWKIRQRQADVRNMLRTQRVLGECRKSARNITKGNGFQKPLSLNFIEDNYSFHRHSSRMHDRFGLPMISTRTYRMQINICLVYVDTRTKT